MRYSISHVPPVAVAATPVSAPSGPPLRAVRSSQPVVHGSGGALFSMNALAQRATAMLNACDGGARSPGCTAVTPPRQLSATTCDSSSKQRSYRAPSPERLRWALLAARRELEAWPSRELRQVVEEELLELQRSGISLDPQTREQTSTRQLGSGILSALGLDGVSWPESVWREMPQMVSCNGVRPSKADVDSAMQLARAVLERACTDLDGEKAEQTRQGQLQRQASYNSPQKVPLCRSLVHAISSPDGLLPHGVRSATASKPQTPPGMHRRLGSRPAEGGKRIEGEETSSHISKPWVHLEPRVHTHVVGTSSSTKRTNGSYISGGVRVLSPSTTLGEPRATDERSCSTAVASANCAAVLSSRDMPDSAPLVYAPSINAIRVVRPSPAEAHAFRTTPVAVGRPAESCITPPHCSASSSSSAHVAVNTRVSQLRGPAAASLDSTGPMHSASSTLSFDEEVSRLKEDLAVERAERHALASRVETLLRLQQKAGSRRSGSPPSLTAATPEGTPTPPTADPSIANASQADNISGGASAARLLHGRPWSSGSDSACSARVSGADAISAGMQAGESNIQFNSGAEPADVSNHQEFHDSRSWPGHDSERAMEPLQRVAEHRSGAGSCRAAEGDAVQDAMLADARAILAELEQDLAGAGPVSSKPEGMASSAPEELMRPLLPETADVPHVLSFYRRKCLELATQVQKRDTEVVNLRRALNEARSMGSGCG